MSSNGNGIANGTNGKNGKKRRKRIIWAVIMLTVVCGGGYGVMAALRPNRTIDPSKLANVERGVLRLMRLIDNLLESVRIEAGQHSIRQQPVDLADVITDARGLIAPLLRQRQLSIELDESSIGAIVRGDAQRLGQVFVNLIANAAKFAPEGSTIRIGGQRSGSQTEVWVEDEGPGVPEGASGAIFERFQRGADTEPDAPGLGLGLWIVKSIIERHGGSVRMERTRERRTRFILSLPQEPEDGA